MEKHSYKMCYNVSQTSSPENLSARYKAAIDELMLMDEPAFLLSSFDTPQLKAVVEIEGKRVLTGLEWGLIPSWIKTEQDAAKLRLQTANAMSETAFEKPSFRSAIKTGRCIIPVDGFFEWMHKEKKTFPHYIYRKDRQLMNLAGIWETWINNETGEEISSCSILTSAANEMMSRIHNVKKRMPVILEDEKIDSYLDKKTNLDDVKALLKPCSEDVLEAYTISRLITSRTEERNRKELLDRFNYPELLEQTSLF